MSQHESAHRTLFTRAAELAADFRDGIVQRPPYATLEVDAVQALFDGPTPDLGEEPMRVLEALDRAAQPGLSGSTGARFFGWVIGASDPVGVAADMMTSAWGQNAGAAACSPAAAAAERVVGQWLLDLLHLPRQSSVGFVTGATMAGFVCLAAARSAVLERAGWDVEADGLQGAPRVRVLLGADAHTTIHAALRYLGFGSRAQRIATDAQGRMDAEALDLALSADTGPAIVISQAGQICTGAFDPFAAIAAVCRKHCAWLHVDGAFGLWAMAVPELQHLTTGCADADSWSVDGHKWLQLPYDSGFAIVHDGRAHQRAMSITASYLPAADLPDPGQLVPELSRRARGFAAWAQIRALGRAGIVRLVASHCALARRVAARLAQEAGVHVRNEVCLNQVILSFGDGPVERRDELTRGVIEELRREGEVLAGGADWHGEWVLRLSVIASPLHEADVDALCVAIVRAWDRCRRKAFHVEG
jgi:glutamate/tyrosine decarboxylase-like PLP-dependent enzyme